MNIAVLIDAENVLPSLGDAIFTQAASMGPVVHREIFGASSALSAWVEPVLKYAIHPNLTIKAAKGKNSSDIALVIGAMDLLAAGDVDCMIIASSDSDFSSLSVRLRNAGIDVVGMGTDKSNQLWRTACSRFVVLQPPQARASQSRQAARPAAQQPSQAQSAPAQDAQGDAAASSGKRAKAPVAGTHEERMAVIRAFIEKRLRSNGGRLPSDTIFTALNRLPEYKVDKQGSGRKPLNYLISTFGDVFRFEEAPDGKRWVSTSDAKPLPPAEPGEAAEAAPLDDAEVPASEDTARTPEIDDTAAVDASAEDESDALALLVNAGLETDVAQQIVVIFTESPNLRTAYNRLRTTFGSTVGREYYQLVKDIAEGR
ncbi:MAG: NYN domain-containing protein [Clostridia bacterium]|nr:NYN domain-containing protein [Clostridia bacterium]